MTSLHVTAQATLTNRQARTIDISPGARVRINRWDGTTATCTVREGIDEKDGRTVIDLTDGTWAYTAEIEGGSPAKQGSLEVSHHQDSDDGWDDDDEDDGWDD